MNDILKNARDSGIENQIKKVRDPYSRSLINEAYTNYLNCSYRSAQVSVWTAITYDMYAKVVELYELGETRVNDFHKRAKSAFEKNDDGESVGVINRDLLNDALKDLDIISMNEIAELKLIKNKRNLCVHPSPFSEQVIYDPKPETVKSNIVEALDLLLVQAPLQGSNIEELFGRDIVGISFPTDEEKIRTRIRERYVKRIRDNAIVRIIKCIISLIFGEEREIHSDKVSIFAVALSEISKLKPEIFNSTMPNLLRARIDQCHFNSVKLNVENRPLISLCTLFKYNQSLWNFLNPSDKDQIYQLVETGDSTNLREYGAFDAISVPELGDKLLNRLESVDDDEKYEIISSCLDPKLVKMILKLYTQSSNFRDTQKYGENLIAPHSIYFDQSSLQIFLSSVQTTPQILEADNTATIVFQVFENTRGLLPSTRKSWKKFVRSVLKDSEKGKEIYLDIQAQISNQNFLSIANLNFVNTLLKFSSRK